MKAATLLESVARFCPLIDGNKRTVWTLMVLLLWVNGYRHDFTTDEGSELVAADRIELRDSGAEISRRLGAPLVMTRFAVRESQRLTKPV